MSMISLIIPAYNEQNRILRTISGYYKALGAKKRDFEIIVVANNCSDGTARVVRGFMKKNPRCRLLEVPHKTGKGGAIRLGFNGAKGKWLCYVDADSSTPPQEFEKVLSAAMEGRCIAIASRALKGSEVIGQPQYRKYLGRGFNFIVNLLFDTSISDTQCGAKIFPRKEGLTLMGMQSSSGWEFDVELLWHAREKKFKIEQVPVVWTEYGESKLSLFSIPIMFIGLVRMRLREFSR